MFYRILLSIIVIIDLGETKIEIEETQSMGPVMDVIDIIKQDAADASVLKKRCNELTADFRKHCKPEVNMMRVDMNVAEEICSAIRNAVNEISEKSEELTLQEILDQEVKFYDSFHKGSTTVGKNATMCLFFKYAATLRSSNTKRIYQTVYLLQAPIIKDERPEKNLQRWSSKLSHSPSRESNASTSFLQQKSPTSDRLSKKTNKTNKASPRLPIIGQIFGISPSYNGSTTDERSPELAALVNELLERPGRTHGEHSIRSMIESDRTGEASTSSSTIYDRLNEPSSVSSQIKSDGINEISSLQVNQTPANSPIKSQINHTRPISPMKWQINQTASNSPIRLKPIRDNSSIGPDKTKAPSPSLPVKDDEKYSVRSKSNVTSDNSPVSAKTNIESSRNRDLPPSGITKSVPSALPITSRKTSVATTSSPKGYCENVANVSPSTSHKTPDSLTPFAELWEADKRSSSHRQPPRDHSPNKSKESEKTSKKEKYPDLNSPLARAPNENKATNSDIPFIKSPNPFPIPNERNESAQYVEAIRQSAIDFPTPSREHEFMKTNCWQAMYVNLKGNPMKREKINLRKAPNHLLTMPPRHRFFPPLKENDAFSSTNNSSSISALSFSYMRSNSPECQKIDKKMSQSGDETSLTKRKDKIPDFSDHDSATNNANSASSSAIVKRRISRYIKSKLGAEMCRMVSTVNSVKMKNEGAEVKTQIGDSKMKTKENDDKNHPESERTKFKIFIVVPSRTKSPVLAGFVDVAYSKDELTIEFC